MPAKFSRSFSTTLVHIEGTKGSVRILQDFKMVVVSDGKASTTDVSTRY
jgi:hypothetical protein